MLILEKHVCREVPAAVTVHVYQKILLEIPAVLSVTVEHEPENVMDLALLIIQVEVGREIAVKEVHPARTVPAGTDSHHLIHQEVKNRVGHHLTAHLLHLQDLMAEEVRVDLMEEGVPVVLIEAEGDRYYETIKSFSYKERGSHEKF